MSGTLVYAGVLKHNALQPRSLSYGGRCGQGCVGISRVSASRFVATYSQLSNEVIELRGAAVQVNYRNTARSNSAETSWPSGVKTVTRNGAEAISLALNTNQTSPPIKPEMPRPV